MSLPNAFITLLTTPSYLPGALVLLHSLIELHPAPRDFKIVCLVTPETVDAKTIGQLRNAGFDLVVGVEPIGSGIPGQDALNLMGRPDLNLALTKLHLFRLYPLFTTLIYLDADVLPLRPLSHLFTTTYPHIISASPDTGWPDCFNSGVMVIRPRGSDWEGMRALLKNGEGDEGIYNTNGCFDGADQGLLNEWFSEEGGGGQWNRLSFTYNVTPSAAYQWAPAYRRYGHKINAVHFIGPNKPWANLYGRPAGMSLTKGNEQVYDYPSLIDRWFALYDRHIRPTAAHAPDLAKRFTVPETTAIWNTSGVPQQPDDRLDLSQLRVITEFGSTSLLSGQYVSMPVDGRIDLMMPKPKTKVRFAVPPSPPVEAAIPSTITAPSQQTIQQQNKEAVTWDAQRFAPPLNAGPEMAVPLSTKYHNAWEKPSSEQTSWYSAPTSHSEPRYPILPESVRSNEWYKEYRGKTPNPNDIQAVFPWEERGQHLRQAERIFPQDASYPLQLAPSVQGSKQHVGISAQAPTPASISPSMPPAQPPRSMSEAMATYTNAWDNMPSIRQYVTRLQAIDLPKQRRNLDVMGLQSVPGTPAREISGMNFSTDRGPDQRSEASGDGDDEDDSDESLGGMTGSSPSVGQLEGLGFSQSLLPDPSLRTSFDSTHRVQQAQSDKSSSATVRESMLPSPPKRTIALPRRLSKNRQPSSSSENARPGSTVLIPPSDTVAPGSARRVPFPQHGGAIVAASRSQSITPPKAVDAKTDSGVPKNRGSERQWNPNTDLDARKRDTQEVLTRFMQAGSFAKQGDQGGQTIQGTPGAQY